MESTYFLLVNACKLLTSERASERKQQVSKIVDFITESKVIDILDKNSSELEDPHEEKAILTWNKLFIICKNYVVNELSLLVTSSNVTLTHTQSTSTQTTSTLVENKILQYRNLINSIVNQANSNGNFYLSGTTFVSTLFQFFDELSSFKIIQDLSHHLYTNILNYDKYCSELNKKHWQQLIKTYTKFYLNPIDTLDLTCCAKCIQIVVNKCCIYSSVYDTSKLFAFFQIAFEELNKDATQDLLESLLTTMNQLCKTYENECLVNIYKLCEGIFDKLLSILCYKHNYDLKMLVVDFFLIQINLRYNPKLSASHKFYHKLINYDSNEWFAESLRRIGGVISDEIDEFCEKYKISKTNFSQIEQNQAMCKYYELLSRCYIESNLFGTDNLIKLDEQTSKRRKLNTNSSNAWHFIYEDCLVNNHLKVYSWLYLVNLTHTHIPKELILTKIEKILVMLHQINEVFVLKMAFKTLISIISYHKSINIDYNSLLYAAMNKNKIEQLKEITFKLMRTIVKHKLVDRSLIRTHSNALVHQIISNKKTQIDLHEYKFILAMTQEGLIDRQAKEMIIEWLFNDLTIYMMKINEAENNMEPVELSQSQVIFKKSYFKSNDTHTNRTILEQNNCSEIKLNRNHIYRALILVNLVKKTHVKLNFKVNQLNLEYFIDIEHKTSKIHEFEDRTPMEKVDMTNFEIENLDLKEKIMKKLQEISIFLINIHKKHLNLEFIYLFLDVLYMLSLGNFENHLKTQLECMFDIIISMLNHSMRPNEAKLVDLLISNLFYLAKQLNINAIMNVSNVFIILQFVSSKNNANFDSQMNRLKQKLFAFVAFIAPDECLKHLKTDFEVDLNFKSNYLCFTKDQSSANIKIIAELLESIHKNDVKRGYFYLKLLNRLIIGLIQTKNVKYTQKICQIFEHFGFNDINSLTKFDSLECHKLLVRLMANLVHLKVVSGDADFDAYLLKFYSNFTGKSAPIRVEFIDCLNTFYQLEEVGTKFSKNIFDRVYLQIIKSIDSLEEPNDFNDRLIDFKSIKFHNSLTHLRLNIYLFFHNILIFAQKYESKCLVAFLHLIKLHGSLIITENFKIVIEKVIRNEYGLLKTSQEYLFDNLNDLVVNWLKLGYDIEEFPFEFFGFNQKEVFLNEISILRDQFDRYIMKKDTNYSECSTQFLINYVANESNVNEIVDSKKNHDDFIVFLSNSLLKQVNSKISLFSLMDIQMNFMKIIFVNNYKYSILLNSLENYSLFATQFIYKSQDLTLIQLFFSFNSNLFKNFNHFTKFAIKNNLIFDLNTTWSNLIDSLFHYSIELVKNFTLTNSNFNNLACDYYLNMLNFINTLPNFEKSNECFTKIVSVVKESAKLSQDFVQLKNFIYILHDNGHFSKEFPHLSLKTSSTNGLRQIFSNEYRIFISLYDERQIRLLDYHMLFIYNILKKLNGEDLLLMIDDLIEFLEIMLKICASSCYSESLKDLCCKCIAKIGPITKKIDHNNEFKSEHLLDKLQVKHQFYFNLFNHLFQLLFDSNVLMASLSYELLLKIFKLPSTCVFLQEYDSIMRNQEKINYFFEYSIAFRCKNPKALSMNLRDINEDSLDIFNRDELWVPMGVSYETWIVKFCLFMIQSGSCNDEICVSSVELFKNQPSLCEEALKFVVHKILNDSSLKAKKQLIATCFSRNLKKFLEQCHLKNNQIQMKCIKCMIGIIEFARIQFILSEKKSSFWTDPFWSHLNFIHIAESSQKCGLFFTSLYYLEIWFKEMNMCDTMRDEPLAVELLIQAYKSIGQDDALSENFIYLNTLNPLEKMRHLNSSNLFDFDSQLKQDSCSNQNYFMLLQSLKSNALDFTLSELMSKQSPSHECNDLIDMKYECAWRLGDWHMVGDDDLKQRSLNKNIFDTLKTFKTNINQEALLFFCEKTEKNLLNDLKSIDINLKNGLYHLIGHLYSIDHVKCGTNFDENYQKSFDTSNFQLKDTILGIQISILKDSSCDSHQIMSLYNEIISNAITHKRFFIAKKYLNEVRREIPHKKHLEIDLKETKVLVECGEFNRARLLLSNNIEFLQKSQDNIELYIQYLNEYAQVLDKMKCENPLVIIRDYLDLALELIDKKSIKNDQLITSTHFSMAKFADLQFKSISTYMRSSTFEQKAELMKQFQVEAEKVEKIEPNSRLYVMLRKQLNIDSSEIQSLNKDREEYLLKAIKSYFLCLQLTDEHDAHVSFRLISLWTENNTNASVNRLFEAYYNRVATWKFLPLIYQLAARLSLNQDKFSRILFNLIFKTAENHPYHVLPIIFAHSNTYKDDNMIKQDDDRLNAAKYLIENLKKHHLEVITSMESLFDAYIDLANLTVDPKRGPYQLSRALKSIKNCYVATKNIEISKKGDYSNVVKVIKFESSYTLAGGVNLPKIIVCLGSDGVSRRQLVKGRDDLRQDAIMQQMFSMVNRLLKLNSLKDFCIRCYKVIPLSQKSGLIEWCDDTISLGDWLVERDGAHQRYRPQDWLYSDCKKKLYDTHGSSVDKITKLNTYAEICDNFKPVFRNFFFENFLQPHDWYEKRLNYTRSVACSNIIGYIIGLGDRHCQNILIDKHTADVIHIDLGVAFDQGKILPIPETVPFRLTRDIVDAFGICGIEGVFTHSCELIMQLMMDSREEIMTIFEVLLYDPLYNWSISPKKAYLLQPNTNESTLSTSSESCVSISIDNCNQDRNKIAERIIFTIRQKLLGYDNSGFQLSCSGLVKSLVQEAMNPLNLCRIYAGWQPYL